MCRPVSGAQKSARDMEYANHAPQENPVRGVDEDVDQMIGR